MVRFRPLDPWDDPRGGQIERVRIDNGILALEVLSLGGIIRSLWTPDRNGERGNIVLGCDSAEDYLTQDAHLGAVAGRYANRIANGQMTFDGEHYYLDKNQANNCLHGGREGFNRKQWNIGQLPDGVRLSLVSPDGDMGFPGNCNIQVDYRLVANNLYVEMFAATDRACPLSMTQHSYFNLEGSRSGGNGNHRLQIDSTEYLETNSTGIPNSIIAGADSNLDFRKSKTLASKLKDTDGLDHCYLMRNNDKELLRFGNLSAPESGRCMTLYTNQPGVQVYGANFLEGNPGRNEQKLKRHQAVCIEPQQLPDAPNQTELLGDPWIKPGQIYHHISRYQFETF
ncbi:Aldose 1-epimerase [Shewanella sediminis HAW-EB3]|uniref:Aldose 1-epimerase n=1 Tax=Shewanella sediminis (strain HAW-EB3) TaxID=425104 RepID=A8G0K2_SHESH|nr:aldose epimerase family protein [Shewanella sediminis]ABV38625.1 Aldose 1-epimerase [Shewanella sediminis HAW-EB3]